jgi:hypothetical protein
MFKENMGPVVITIGSNFHVFQSPVSIYNATCPIVRRTLLERAA